jgi:microcystin-dependent protein
MAGPHLGEIRMFRFGTVPPGWAPCNGQILPISENQALFSVLGTTYGGDGRTTFALPDLQGRLPVHVGGGIALGQSGGELTHTLSPSEMPAHNHQMMGTASPGPSGTPGPSATLAQYAWQLIYASDGPLTQMSRSAIATDGDSQAHENCMPYLTVSFCISLTGVLLQRGRSDHLTEVRQLPQRSAPRRGMVRALVVPWSPQVP